MLGMHISDELPFAKRYIYTPLRVIKNELKKLVFCSLIIAVVCGPHIEREILKI